MTSFRQSQRFQIQGWEDTRTDAEIEAENAPRVPSYWEQVRQARIARIGHAAYVTEVEAEHEQLRAALRKVVERVRHDSR